ncbi:MAG: nitrate reductase molybdenum cofactor assembly chaperone [Nocardioidaceae bacterium]
MSVDARAAHQVASLLLSYPDQDLLDRAPLLRRAAEPAAAEVRTPLLRFLDHLESKPLGELQRDYVATFDMKRRRCLYLTFWTHGDTRVRGQALLAFKERYAASGARFEAAELPDHLAVVLEFAATVDPDAGVELLVEHRPALTLIREALAAANSPYSHVIDAVEATLPAAGGDVLDRARRIARDGPPRETVGLEPYPVPPSMESLGGRR